MAIVKLPLLSEQASGRLGENLVFKRSRGLNIVSARPTTTNANPSPRQLAVRSILAELGALYTTLTPAQVASWENLQGYKPISVFGLPVPKSALNAFLQINFFRRDRALAANLSAPGVAMKGNVSAFAAGGGGPGELELNWTLPAGALAADAVDVWLAGPRPTLTRRIHARDYRHMLYAAGNLTTHTFTGLDAAQFYAVRARFVMADGRVESFVQSDPVQINPV